MAVYDAGTGRARAWDGMRPSRFRSRRFDDLEFDELRRRYVEEHGYVITVPDWEEVVHWRPDYFIPEAELQERALRQFTSILASPEPGWNRAYSSIMTAVDNIQDAVSTGFVAANIIRRAAPKLLFRFIPYMGWALLGLDIINLINSIGRTPFSPMGAKRNYCKHIRKNPFSKNMQKHRVERIKRMRPGLGSLLELAQVGYDMSGVGLALGSITSFVTNLAFGAYRQFTGEQVTIRRDPPPLTTVESIMNRTLASSSLVTSENPIFTRDFHHKTYFALTIANDLMGPYLEEALVDDIIEDPTKKLIPAPRPWNKRTIAIIENAGYSVEDGIRWPAYGDKAMPAGELCDWHEKQSQAVFNGYLKREKFNPLGMLCGGEYCESLPHLYDSVEPSSDTITEIEPAFELMTQYLRTPILFDGDPDPTKVNNFRTWVNNYHTDHGQLPNVHYAKKKGEEMGITWKTSYPSRPVGDVNTIYPEWEAAEASTKNWYMDAE